MAAFETWPDLDPNEVLDYGFDWADRIDVGDTIIASTWEVAIGDVQLNAEDRPPTISGTIVKVWLTGGTLGETCNVTNHVEMASGRKRDRTAKLKIKGK